MKKLILGLLLVAGVSHAAVNSETMQSTYANIMFSSCSAQRNGVDINYVRNLAIVGNPRVTQEKVRKMVDDGYSWSVKFPRVGCNQIFITIIDELVKRNEVNL